MRLFILIISALFFTASLQAQREQVSSWERTRAEWKETVSYEGRFAVSSPGPLTERADTVVTPVGEMVYHTFFFQTPTDTADNVFYMLSYTTYPEGSVHHDSTDLLGDFFRETIDAALDEVRGELMFVTPYEQTGFPGRYWRIDFLDGKASVRTKAFVVDNRYYALQTITRRETGINPSTDRFMDSFRLLRPDTKSKKNE